MKLKSILTRRRVGGLVGLLLVVVFILGMIGELRPVVRRAYAKPPNGPVRVDCQAEIVGGDVQVFYRVVNTTPDTILVFDQMWQENTGHETMPYGMPDDSWAYVEFERDGWSFSGWSYKAIISRRIMDQGYRMHYRAPLPYGRRLAAGESLTGSFRIPLPLKEDLARDRNDPRKKDMPFDTRLDVREFELWIGWTADVPLESELESGVTGQFSYRDMKLWFLSPGCYPVFEAMQQIAVSATKPVRWRGLLY